MSGLTTTGLEEGDWEMGRWLSPVLRQHATVPHRPFLHAADLLQGKKNAFILFQTPQTNEAAGLNCNLETGKMWTIGTQKHWFGIFGLGTVCFFSLYFPWLINNNISLGKVAEVPLRFAANHHWPSCNLYLWNVSITDILWVRRVQCCREVLRSSPMHF